MSTSVKKHHLSVHLWTMLGPLFIAGTVLAMYLHPVPPLLALPFISLGGLLLCYFWRWQGCLAACLFLLGTSAFQLFHYPSLGIYWTMLLSACFAFSLIVTTLFLDESQIIFAKLAGHSLQAEEALKELEKLASLKTSAASEREVFLVQLEELKRESAEKKEKLQSSEKLIEIARKELTAFHVRQETLLQELFEARQQAAMFEQQNARLQDENIRAHTAMSEAVRSVSAKEADQYKNQSEEAKVLHDALIHEMQENVKALTIEKQSLEKTLSTLQSEFEAVALKAKSKSDSLEAKAFEIHSLKAAIGKCDEEIRSEKNKYNALKISYEDNEKKLISQIENIKNECEKKEKELLVQKVEQIDFLKNECAQACNEKEMLLVQNRQQLENFREEVERLKEKELLLTQTTEQVENLKVEIERLVKEKELLVQKIESEKFPELLNEEDELKRFRELRRMEGLYRQMREQFNEKSHVLDNTRRELFQSQETVFSLQKKIEEMEFFGENEVEQSLYRIISLTEADLMKRMREFNMERIQLHELVDILMKESATKTGIV